MATIQSPRPLPPGWRCVRLGEVIAEAQPGFACGARDPKGVVQLRMNNVDTWGHMVWEEFIRVPAEESVINEYRLRPGDVLFNNTNSVELVGKSALFPGFREHVVYSNHFTRLRALPEQLDPQYFAAWLLQQWQLKVFESICNRWIGQSAVKNDKLLALEIPLPPVEEQKRIAAILKEQMAAVERARAAAEAQLEAAKALPAAYLHAAFSSPEAQQWPTSQLGMLCDIQLGKMLSPASRIGLRPRPYLRNANVQWGKFDLADIARMDFTEDQERKFALRSGDLLVCEGGEPGRAAVWDGRIPSCLYQKAIHRLRPISNAVDPHFVMYRLWMGALQQEFLESHAKTTIAHLPAVRLQRLPIRVPAVPEQQRIAVTLNEQMASAERARKAIEEELDVINKLPAALLRRAFNGEL
jgi:type I restriction enzyme S subunit